MAYYYIRTNLAFNKALYYHRWPVDTTFYGGEVMNRFTNFNRAFNLAWSDSFPCDGFDPVYETTICFGDGGPFSDSDYSRNQHKTRLFTFLGLPNRIDHGASWASFFKQLFWLPYDRPFHWSDIFRVITFGLPRAVLTLTLFSLPTFALNLVKLCSEFPLTFLRNYALFNVAHAKSSIGHYTAILFYGLFSLLLFPVRAITSPAKNARAALKFGRDLGNGGIFGLILGGFFSGLSVAATVAAYTLLLPLGAKMLLTQALPYLSSVLPGALSKGIAFLLPKMISGVNTLANLLTPASNVIGPFLANICAPAIQYLGSVPFLAPAVQYLGLSQVFTAPTLGFSAIAAGTLGTVGLGLARIKDAAAKVLTENSLIDMVIAVIGDVIEQHIIEPRRQAAAAREAIERAEKERFAQVEEKYLEDPVKFIEDHEKEVEAHTQALSSTLKLIIVLDKDDPENPEKTQKSLQFIQPPDPAKLKKFKEKERQFSNDIRRLSEKHRNRFFDPTQQSPSDEEIFLLDDPKAQKRTVESSFLKRMMSAFK